MAATTEPTSDLIGRGVFASRPAAGVVGRLYFPTDVSGVVYRDNGTSWDTVALGGSGSPAASAGALVYAYNTFR